ncbi:MAG: hypothetical protein KDB96_17950 [Flavobacteriales bacterium]|nr:hypothetical protein [Flavobacteriales bacterium]MCB0811164.1 hypothetical protein [Flavobacteriales bacterium]MCB0815119.1 hypothetical protein [Flavobacteriales bacterium]
MHSAPRAKVFRPPSILWLVLLAHLASSCHQIDDPLLDGFWQSAVNNPGEDVKLWVQDDLIFWYWESGHTGTRVSYRLTGDSIFFLDADGSRARLAPTSISIHHSGEEMTLAPSTTVAIRFERIGSADEVPQLGILSRLELVEQMEAKRMARGYE